MSDRYFYVFNTPASRALVAGAAVTALLWLTKPSAVFRSDGRPRVAAWAARLDQELDATYVPWYAITVGTVIAVDLFV